MFNFNGHILFIFSEELTIFLFFSVFWNTNSHLLLIYPEELPHFFFLSPKKLSKERIPKTLTSTDSFFYIFSRTNISFFMSSRILTHPSLIYPEEITDLLFSMYQNTKQRVKSHIANLNKPIFYTSSEELTIFIFFRHPKNVTIFLIFFRLPKNYLTS